MDTWVVLSKRIWMSKASGQRIVEPYRVDLHGAFIRRTDLSGATLVGADFSGADAEGANFPGADFRDANLVGTVLKGADLRDARHLTVEQLSRAVIDDATKLPDDIDRTALEQSSHTPRERP